MTQIEYGIQPWSYKTYRARQNYHCDNCGGVIPKGTTYLRHVVRQGPRKGKDPLQNKHEHLDCQAPWHHPEGDDRCRNLRQLPARIPPADKQNQRLMASPLVVRVDGEHGTLLWQLPADLSQRLLHAPNEQLLPGAMAELEQGLSLVLRAMHKAAGNRRVGMRLSHVLHELQRMVE